MVFESILFAPGEDPGALSGFERPDCFRDLNLDQVEAALLEAEKEYQLESYFRVLPASLKTLRYRQGVMRAFGHAALRDALEAFSLAMRESRVWLSHHDALKQPDQRRKWRLDAALRCMDGQVTLARVLTQNQEALCSEGLKSFGKWLLEHVAGEEFSRFRGESLCLKKDIEEVRYSLTLDKGCLSVGEDDTRGDLCAGIRKTFSEMADMPDEEEICFFSELEMGQLERHVLEKLREKHPALFQRLCQWDASCPVFPDPLVQRFDREVRFYLAWTRFIEPLQAAGYRFNLPKVEEEPMLAIHGLFDLALAIKRPETGVVPNDCLLEAGERLMILTGPNQGGKTTFARALGQSVYLAALGCHVPGREARVFFCDSVHTHFASEEESRSHSGRLREELVRLRNLMPEVTSRTLVLFNELFATTTTLDALDLGRLVLDRFRHIGSYCLYVTHLVELVHALPDMVSLVASVASDRQAMRTFRIIRRPADGRAYAETIAARYDLDAMSIRERLGDKPVTTKEGGVSA